MLDYTGEIPHWRAERRGPADLPCLKEAAD
jgi:hypothetical protein